MRQGRSTLNDAGWVEGGTQVSKYQKKHSDRVWIGD